MLGTPKVSEIEENNDTDNDTELKANYFPEFDPLGVGFIRKLHSDFDDNAEHLLLKMLSLDERERPNCQIVLRHPFFED